MGDFRSVESPFLIVQLDVFVETVEAIFRELSYSISPNPVAGLRRLVAMHLLRAKCACQYGRASSPHGSSVGSSREHMLHPA